MMTNRYVVIVGCGRLGSYLANNLSYGGDSVVVIDRNEETFQNLSPEFSGFRIDGDATQVSVLSSAKIRNADIFIATTHEDNVNLMVAQVAKKIFHVPQVLARVFDPKREKVYAKLEIETICPTSVAARMFLDAVSKGKRKPEGGVS